MGAGTPPELATGYRVCVVVLFCFDCVCVKEEAGGGVRLPFVYTPFQFR